MTLRQTSRLPLFLAVALSLNLAIAAIVRLHPDARVLLAASADLLVTIPLLYYFLVIRSGAQSWITLVPVLLAGLLRTSLLMPSTFSWKPAVGIFSEVALLALVAYRVRSGESNFVTRAVTAELSLLGYAFFSWRRRSEIPAGARAFTLHRESGIVTLFGLLAAVSVVEAAGVHLIVQRWNPTAAWVITALSLYGAVLLVALARSILLQPVLITADDVYLRFGLLRQARIARSNIASIQAAGDPLPKVKFTGGADLRQVIHTHEPVVVEYLYGFRRETTAIAVTLDGVADLEKVMHS